MAYKHGIYTSEVATSLVPMTSTSGGLVVAFGTAPVHLASDPADANTPVLCHTYKEAVAALGYSDDWEKYTLAEVIKTQFALYNVAPIVLVNVLDAKKHKKDVQNKQMAIVDGVVATTDPVLLKTLEVKLSASHQKLAQDKDYTAAYDDDGRLIVTPIPGGGVPSGTTELCLSYTLLLSAVSTRLRTARKGLSSSMRYSRALGLSPASSLRRVGRMMPALQPS